MNGHCKLQVFCLYTVAMWFLFALGWQVSSAQEAQQKPSAGQPAKSIEKAEKPEKALNPAQIELLETKVRFESNGDSRKEVHALVKINSELGVRQFAQLNFDFNRSFESVEIPLVHITHANGGTADILPGAITDHPNPAVVNAPAYQDMRVKSVRILGLQPGDTLEYRVVRTVSHPPLAPDFWFEHTFDRTGIVLREDLTLELPPGRGYVQVNPDTPAETMTGTGGGYMYRWQRKQKAVPIPHTEEPEQKPDISAGTFATEAELSADLAKFFYPDAAPSAAVAAKAHELTEGTKDDEERLRALYAFVSRNIATVDVPVGATGFRSRAPEEILKSGVAVPQDKATLLIALVASVVNFKPTACLAFQHDDAAPYYSLPARAEHILLGVAEGVFGKPVWMDPAVEVAPFGMIPSIYRRKTVLCASSSNLEQNGLGFWERVPDGIPFAAFQKVHVDASLAADGKLIAKVHYSMRGDNELVLRVAFHQSPKEKWKELAQLLSITDGFRGQVTSVTASDPYATKEPFSVEYELEQPKLVDWSKKNVRIPALLPQLGLPDLPAKPSAGTATAPIELGTPLEVETRMTLHLPPGTTATTPTGTSVDRDYATYASQYSLSGSTITASRHIKFLLREIPGTRAADYNAFVRAVQSDEAQDFALERAETTPSKANPAAPNTAASPNTVPTKP